MSRVAERIAMKLARFVAGPARSCWLDAMEAELGHLPARRLDWALGSLVAAVKDRVSRDWSFGLALGLLPGLAVVAAVVLSAAIGYPLKLAGIPPVFSMLPQVLAPLPFAYLLGRVRPTLPALWVGTAGFLGYQMIPWAAWRATAGPGMWFFWGPTLWPLGVPLPLVLPIWLAGAWWGVATARRASDRKITPPSP